MEGEKLTSYKLWIISFNRVQLFPNYSFTFVFIIFHPHNKSWDALYHLIGK